MKDNTFHSIWFHAQRALRNVNAYQYRPADQTYSYGPRRWWLSLNESFDLHPVIRNIVEKHCVRPADWQLLLLEWPHVSIEDDSKIAYTRNEENGQDFLRNGSARQTKTTIGKYLSRHWPHVPDHIRRDWAGVFGVSQFDIWDTKEGIISSVELGPQSCMKSSYGSIPFLTSDNETLLQYHAGTANAAEVPWHRHPYFVYNPEYGWRAAVRYASGKPTVSKNWVAGTVATQVKAYVYDDADNLFEVQVAASGTGYVQTAIGAQANLVFNAPNATTGQSTSALNATLIAAASQGQFRIVGFGPEGIYDATTNPFPTVLVKIAQHQFIANKTAI